MRDATTPARPAASSLRTRIQTHFVWRSCCLLCCFAAPLWRCRLDCQACFVLFFFLLFCGIRLLSAVPLLSHFLFPPWNCGYSTVCARFVDHLVNPPLGRLSFPSRVLISVRLLTGESDTQRFFSPPIRSYIHHLGSGCIARYELHHVRFRSLNHFTSYTSTAWPHKHLRLTFVLYNRRHRRLYSIPLQ